MPMGRARSTRWMSNTMPGAACSLPARWPPPAAAIVASGLPRCRPADAAALRGRQMQPGSSRPRRHRRRRRTRASAPRPAARDIRSRRSTVQGRRRGTGHQQLSHLLGGQFLAIFGGRIEDHRRAAGQVQQGAALDAEIFASCFTYSCMRGSDEKTGRILRAVLYAGDQVELAAGRQGECLGRVFLAFARCPSPADRFPAAGDRSPARRRDSSPP